MAHEIHEQRNGKPVALPSKLSTLAKQINEQCEAARVQFESARESVTSATFAALQAGALLIDAKSLVPHGEWLPWLKKNVSVSHRQAQKWMRVSKEWPAIESNTNRNSHLTIDQGLELIAEPRDAGSEEKTFDSRADDKTYPVGQPATSSDDNGSTKPHEKARGDSSGKHSDGTADAVNPCSTGPQGGRPPVSSENGDFTIAINTIRGVDSKFAASVLSGERKIDHQTIVEMGKLDGRGILAAIRRHTAGQKPDVKAALENNSVTPCAAIEEIEQAVRGVSKLVQKGEKATGGASSLSRQAVANITTLNGTLREWKNNL
ncbi:MAG: DUF3102 domain-containing protein [Planctomycetaceae bacterium]|mgnify:CR=1 FL=1|jgi:hypothetical protein|nr:DUF3102 domain-containing protein [Planctomycetaceae bacterium]